MTDIVIISARRSTATIGTAPYKYPREIEFIPDLPKTISGKIRRTQPRQMERAKLGPKPPT